jgi:adenosine deaminase
MGTTEPRLNWNAYPKVELHLHLDCSLSYKVVQTIDPTIPLEVYHKTFIAPPKCANLADFLTRASQGVTLMQTEQHLRLVVADLFEQLQQDHVLYAEVRFAPLLHTAGGLSAQEVVEVVNEATVQASLTNGIEARLILCTLRHYTAEQSMQTVQLLERFRRTSVVALDLAGDEAGFPLDAHVPAFQYAARLGIPRTAHAGEALGAASVWETLRHLRPSRIGHGVRSIEDAALIDRLRRERLHLEMCPTSNVQTGVCTTYAEHPVRQLYKSGLSLGVNTDARTISNITLRQEYERLHATFGWNEPQFLQCTRHAIQAAFLPEAKKQQLEKRVQAAASALG